MATFDRFLFTTSFDPVDAAPTAPDGEAAPLDDAAPEPEAPPLFTQDEVEAAHAAALAAGREQGLSESSAAVEARLAAALESVAAALADTRAAFEADAARRERDAVDVALAMTRRAFPALDRTHGLDEIAALFADIAAAAVGPAALTVAVDAEQKDVVADRLAAIAAPNGGGEQVRVIGDPDLPAGTCRIRWDGGGADRDLALLTRNIEAAVTGAYGPAPAPAATEAA